MATAASNSKAARGLCGPSKRARAAPASAHNAWSRWLRPLPAAPHKENRRSGAPPVIRASLNVESCETSSAFAPATNWSKRAAGGAPKSRSSSRGADRKWSIKAFFSGLPCAMMRSPYGPAAGSPPSLRDEDLLRPHRSPYCLLACALCNRIEKCPNIDKRRSLNICVSIRAALSPQSQRRAMQAARRKAEPLAESEQRKNHRQRMQANALTDQIRCQEVTFEQLPDAINDCDGTESIPIAELQQRSR